MLRRLPAKADRHTADVLPIIEYIRATGVVTLLAIAAELNERQMLTARRQRVMRMLARSDK